MEPPSLPTPPATTAVNTAVSTVTATTAVKANVDEFLYEVGQREREDEIKRILTSAFRLDPFDILTLPPTATPQQIQQKYRSLSLLCHPDKAAPELRDNAQKAFAMLLQAKNDLLDEVKRAQLVQVYQDAATQVKTTRDKEEARAAKLFKQTHPDSKAPPPPIQWPTTLEEAIKIQAKENFADQEWRRRQLLKMAAEEEGKAATEIERRKQMREQKEKSEKDWEDGRERRVNDWREFARKTKKRKILRPFKSKDAASRTVKTSWDIEQEQLEDNDSNANRSKEERF